MQKILQLHTGWLFEHRVVYDYGIQWRHQFKSSPHETQTRVQELGTIIAQQREV